ncbi:uncharacterized protein N7479_005263 [Penicillium vulpinum]|uniref:Uncharacterized protein n=1 Tax=Penicillium vulpinum TaxID=29845 RepID=A0A1V6RI63_9EURO|nr:uncharacterized protein N7479_005263 [Penicillium vulpinum]KAJ5958113.1 hypothetical protein N7479_005263 [Penicillium vulpinum]OQE01230.1 hypothetical protein PENVUL_c043G09812 [Penicillium vulpinum]
MRPDETDPLQHPALELPSLLITLGSELRSPVALGMSEKKKARKRAKVKRWVRSWVFTPLGKVRIKLVSKIERTRRRSIPDYELHRIVSGALTDRYPSRAFRDRSDLKGSTPRRMSIFSTESNQSLVNLVPMSTKSASPRDKSSRLDVDVANGPLVNKVEIADATAQSKSPNDPRGSWRGDENSVLRIMNPDFYELSSGEEKSEGSDRISVFEVDSNVYELSAIASPDLPAELSGEEQQLGNSRSSSVRPNDGMDNLPVIEELAPQIPDLCFIHQPDPTLCCLVTSALRDSSSPVLFEDGICSCAHASKCDDPVIQHMPSSDMSLSTTITRANPPKITTEEVLLRHTYNKQNAILSTRHISLNVVPRTFIVRKACNVALNQTQNDALLPSPVETSHVVTTPVRPSYSLRRKIQHGPLPPLPPSTSTSHLPRTSSARSSGPANPNSQPPGISSTTHSPSASATPVDLPQYPDRPTSMCNSCLAGRHRPLYSHPYRCRSLQFGNAPLPYPLSPRESIPSGSDSLPASLRSGPQCRHCTTRQSGIISLPVLVGPRPLSRISESFSDTSPDSPWVGPVGHMAFYAGSAEDFPLHIEPDRRGDLCGFEMCLIAGSAAQHRRYR